MNTTIKKAAIWIIAIQFIFFGLNKFFLFFAGEPPADPQAQAYMTGLFGSALGRFVGAVEIAGSILLIIPRTRFIGVLTLLPVMANIIFYHLFHDMPGNGIWIVVAIIFGIVAAGEKDKFTTLLID